jgi:hypothetical protein
MQQFLQFLVYALVGGSHTQLTEIWIDPNFRILPPKKKTLENTQRSHAAPATTRDLNKRC